MLIRTGTVIRTVSGTKAVSCCCRKNDVVVVLSLFALSPSRAECRHEINNPNPATINSNVDVKCGSITACDIPFEEEDVI